MTLSRTLVPFLFGATLALAACGSSSQQQNTMPPPVEQQLPPAEGGGGGGEGGAAAAPDAEVKDICVKAFHRQRECTDTFIPALVALRVKNDVPQGIAAEDAKNGRQALVNKAMGEWKNDSTDEAIDGRCTQMAEHMPAEMKDKMKTDTQQCLATADCKAFTDCVMPVIESHLKMSKQQGGGHQH